MYIHPSRASTECYHSDMHSEANARHAGKHKQGRHVRKTHCRGVALDSSRNNIIMVEYAAATLTIAHSTIAKCNLRDENMAIKTASRRERCVGRLLKFPSVRKLSDTRVRKRNGKSDKIKFVARSLFSDFLAGFL